MPDDSPELATSAIRGGYFLGEAPLPRVGDIIQDHWEITATLGRGGFGAVFQARDRLLGRNVALKFLHTGAANGGATSEVSRWRGEQRESFIKEGRLLARLDHPNVVRVHHVGEWSPRDSPSSEPAPFLVLELAAGESLRGLVGPSARPEVVIHLAEQLAAGVSAIHGQGIVHRDLKPDNVVLTPHGQVKIVDFGLASHESDDRRSHAGTLLYMSPEQLQGHPIDERADLWALGIIFFELLTGEHPWGREGSVLDIGRRILETPPLSLDDECALPPARRSAWTPWFDAIIRGLLERSPERRTASANLLLAAFAEMKSQLVAGGEVPRESSPYRRLAPFDTADAAWFFGREQVTSRLVLKLERQGWLVIAGPSGAGKTSLVQAGVVPELRRLSPLTVMRLRPGRDPLGSVARAVEELTAVATSPELLRASPGEVDTALRAWASRARRRVLVFVDALEELVTEEAPPADAATFGEILRGLTADPERGVFLAATVRDEYLGRLPRVTALAPLLRDAEFLDPPDEPEMLAALREPAARVGIGWETGLAESIVADLRGSVAPLPMLQLTASWLWERRGEATTLTRVLLGAGVGNIIGRYAADKQRAASWTPRDLELVQRMLPALVGREREPRMAARSELLAACAPDERARAEALIMDLTGFGLVTTSLDARRQESVTLTHRALVDGWDLLKDALARSDGFLEFVRRLERDASAWWDGGASRGVKDAAALWPAEAERELSRWRDRLAALPPSPPRSAFISAVHRKASRHRLLRRALLGLVFAFLVGAALAVVMIRQRALEAERQRAAAEDERARALVAEIEAALQADALHVARRSARTLIDTASRGEGSLSPEVGQRLRNVLWKMFQAPLRSAIRLAKPSASVSWSRDPGARHPIGVGLHEGLVELFDPITHTAVVLRPHGPLGAVADVCHLPSGHLVSAGFEGAIARTDVANAVQVGTPHQLPAELGIPVRLGCLDDGRVLVITLDGFAVRVDLDAPSGARSWRIANNVEQAWVSPDGAFVVIAGTAQDGVVSTFGVRIDDDEVTAILPWSHEACSVLTGTRGASTVVMLCPSNRVLDVRERPFDEPPGPRYTVADVLSSRGGPGAISDDGRVVAASLRGGVVAWVRERDRFRVALEQRVPAGSALGGSGIALSPDGRFLAIGTDELRVVALDPSATNPGRHSGSVPILARAGDDPTAFVVGGSEGFVRAWRPRESGRTLGRVDERVMSMVRAHTRRGDALLIGAANGSLHAWFSDGGQDERIAVATRGLLDVAKHPDLDLVLTTSRAGASLVDPGDHPDRILGRVVPLPATQDAHSVAFTSQGDRALVGLLDGTIRTFIVEPTAAEDVLQPGPTLTSGLPGVVAMDVLAPPASQGRLAVILAIGRSSRIVALDAHTGERIGEWSFGPGEWLEDVAVSPSGTQLVVGGKGPTLARLDFRGPGGFELVQRYHGHADEIVGLLWSRDGETFASVDGSGVIRAWLPELARPLGSVLGVSHALGWYLRDDGARSLEDDSPIGMPGLDRALLTLARAPRVTRRASGTRVAFVTTAGVLVTLDLHGGVIEELGKISGVTDLAFVSGTLFAARTDATLAAPTLSCDPRMCVVTTPTPASLHATPDEVLVALRGAVIEARSDGTLGRSWGLDDGWPSACVRDGADLLVGFDIGRVERRTADGAVEVIELGRGFRVTAIAGIANGAVAIGYLDGELRLSEGGGEVMRRANLGSPIFDISVSEDGARLRVLSDVGTSVHWDIGGLTQSWHTLSRELDAHVRVRP